MPVRQGSVFHDEIAMIVCSPVLLWEQYSEQNVVKELVVIAQMILFLAKKQ